MHKKLLKFFLLLGLHLSVIQTFGQSANLNGKITDQKGSPLIGATIRFENAAGGAISDVDGKFSLKVKPGSYKILVTYLGFENYTQTIAIEDNETKNLNIVMQPKESTIKEVVAVGYGTRIKQDITGSVASVKGKEIAELPTQSFETALQGKAAGVQVVSGSGIAGSPSIVRVRGVASISAGGDPLYIVDGVAINQDYFSRGNAGAMNQNPLATINPMDIETVDILKDAAATAIYGARGANGVIIITTKKAKKPGWNFEFNTRVGTSKPTVLPQMLNNQEFLQLYQEAWENDGNVGRAQLPYNVSWEDAEKTNTDWVNNTVHTGLKHMQSFSAGYKDTTHKWGAYLNLTNDDNGSYLIDNKYVRRSVRLNADWEPIKDLKIDLNSSFVNGNNHRVSNGWNGGLGAALSTALPIYPITNRDGSWSNQYGGFGNNPVAMRDLLRWNTLEERSINSLNLNYKISDRLNISAFYGFDYSNLKDDQFVTGTLLNNTDPENGISNRNQSVQNTQTSNLRLNYKLLDLKSHKLDVMAGIERVYNKSTSQFFEIDSANKQFRENPEYLDEERIRKGSEFVNYWAINSAFTRLNYTMNEKYLADLTIRSDGSSRFGPNNRYGFFPALGAGWLISKEDFMNVLPMVNLLKLKSGLGLTGNMPPSENWRQIWIGGNNDIRYNGQPTVYPTNHENPNLKWETSTIFDLTLEAGLYKNRITFELAYYYKLTNDVLVNLATPSSTGFGQHWVNTGSFSNSGVEFSFVTKNIVKKDFTWETQFNIARNYNKVRDLGIYLADAVGGGTNDTRVIVGQPLGTNYLVKYHGVDPNSGRPIYLDKDGNQTNEWKNDNRVAVGSVLPKAIGGLSNNIRYKRFYLTTNFIYQLGGNIYNSSGKRQNGVVTDWNMTTDYFDRWQQPGDDAKYPQLSNQTNNFGLPPDPFQYNTTLFLESATYLRLRSVQLSYSLPEDWVKWARRIEVGVSAFNYLTFSRFTNGDPELARDFENIQDRNMSSNIFYLTPPQEKSLLFNLNITF